MSKVIRIAIVAVLLVGIGLVLGQMIAGWPELYAELGRNVILIGLGAMCIYMVAKVGRSSAGRKNPR
ncbi:hypothetical protein [Corynebacterium sp. HMSC073D01]|uniref:hypothetical protein n=1 Tax=Corynebacterium sp. HMSC073D01 TaxID=1739536 RepID=UPI0008A407A3|nr:hypothetical protein [Corynebacterium sp. HMSC073D01]OFO46601.1 hypothetical protein HMPREF3044_10330 [Corynebacterium sp. HMSC073D01]